MSAQSNHQLLKKLFSMAGVASASLFFCLPGFAQDTFRNNDYSACGGYEGNATTGGGFYCARNQLFPNGRTDSQYRTAPAASSYRDNGGSTTGAGYPGNNVTPQGADDNMNQESLNRRDNTDNEMAPAGSSNRDNGGSTTGAGYPGNNVTPQGDDNMNR